ncbi:MAG: SDR family NAD(P)-dependent oxidoreductase [Pseudomonadota bacterium]
MKNYEGKKIWLIGASSGIGKALARKLAHRGATLVLSARSENELKEIARLIEGDHHVVPLDVSDAKAVEKATKEAHKALGEFDSVIMMAAIYEPNLLRDVKTDDIAKTTNVNLNGTLYLLQNLLPIMRDQGKGQIALTGSVAGYRGLPKGQPYSATKAAIQNIAESLRAEEKELDIRLISPGFVKTPMTDKNDFDMPMAIEPDEAARHIADGLLSKSYEIHFPKTFTYILKTLKIIPNWLYFIVAEQMVKKMEKDKKEKTEPTLEKSNDNEDKAA